MDNDDSTSTKEYVYLEAMLRLFGRLCTGRNNNSIEIIAQTYGYLTWREVCLKG